MGTRRSLLTAGLAGVGASLLPAARAATPAAMPIPATPDEHLTAQVRSEFLLFDDPVARLHAHLRMERRLAEESQTITWYHYVVFMVPETRAPVPLVRYEGMEFSYLRHLGNNNFRIHAHNLSYPRDLDTGAFTATVRNPVTGEDVAIPPTVITNDPGTVHNPTGFRNVNGDGTYQIRYTMFRLQDNLVKLDSVRGAPPELAPVTHQENSCAWCPVDIFTNTTTTSLPAQFTGGYLYEYPAWLKMGDRPGHLFAMFDGRKISSVDELPVEYLDRTRREHPDLLKARWQAFDRPLPFKP
jgi:hypothetical protein